MISIKVNNRQLYIPADTSLVLEQNNNSFDLDNFGSDIIWTFDIPARKNADALESAHYVCVSNHKKYRCEILFNGVVIANGDLYIQSVSDEETVSCGVVLDGLGEEFGKRMLRENDYGDDVVISQPGYTIDQHRANWVQFLLGSLEDDSVYKFFLFSCEKFYKNNKAYGYHEGVRATLEQGHDEKDWCGYINRLFVKVMPNVSVTDLENTDYGLKLFNRAGGSDPELYNGFAFAPALRLDWLTRKVAASAGYSIIGDFLTDSRIQRLYFQSMNAMDADLAQEGWSEHLYVDNAEGQSPASGIPQQALTVGVGEAPFKAFRRQENQTPVVHFKLDLDTSGLRHEAVHNHDFYYYTDEVYALVIWPTGVNGPTLNEYGFRHVVNGSAQNKEYRWGYWITQQEIAGKAGYPLEIATRLSMSDNGIATVTTNNGNIVPNVDIMTEMFAAFVQLTPSVENNVDYNVHGQTNLYDGSANLHRLAWMDNLDSDRDTFSIRLVKMTIQPAKHSGASLGGVFPIEVSGPGQFDLYKVTQVLEKADICSTFTLLNVFDTALRWKEHVPHVSNGDYIRNLCRFFGLSVYVNPFNREIQLSFLDNIFHAGSIDITDYITETERMNYDPERIKVRFDTVLEQKQSADSFRLADTLGPDELPNAYEKKNCDIFIKGENAYRKSELDSDSDLHKWMLSSGNDKTLAVGGDSDPVEEISTGIKVPNMRQIYTDSDLAFPGSSPNRPVLICDIPCSGNSKLMDDDYTGEFDMILMQRSRDGVKAFKVNVGGTASLHAYQAANPTSVEYSAGAYTDSPEHGLQLAAAGDNSVGELWLRKFYKFKSQMEKYRFVARLPLSMFMAVYNLQQPQHVAVCDEKRWIVVKNRRYMPTKISYEFGKGDYVLTTIECARQHFETA